MSLEKILNRITEGCTTVADFHATAFLVISIVKPLKIYAFLEVFIILPDIKKLRICLFTRKLTWGIQILVSTPRKPSAILAPSRLQLAAGSNSSSYEKNAFSHSITIKYWFFKQKRTLRSSRFQHLPYWREFNTVPPIENDIRLHSY